MLFNAPVLAGLLQVVLPADQVDLLPRNHRGQALVQFVDCLDRVQFNCVLVCIQLVFLHLWPQLERFLDLGTEGALLRSSIWKPYFRRNATNQLLTGVIIGLAVHAQELGGRRIPLNVDLVLQRLDDESLLLEAFDLLLLCHLDLLNGQLLGVVD